MPVVIEKIVAPSAQDLIDLEKIYLDYPGAFRYADLQQLQAQQPHLQLFGARFNGRLLAAMTAQALGNSIELNHFCTRSVTRRRGVGKELLRQLLPQFNDHTLHMTLCEASPALQALLLQHGFSQHELQFTLHR